MLTVIGFSIAGALLGAAIGFAWPIVLCLLGCTGQTVGWFWNVFACVSKPLLHLSLPECSWSEDLDPQAPSVEDWVAGGVLGAVAGGMIGATAGVCWVWSDVRAERRKHEELMKAADELAEILKREEEEAARRRKREEEEALRAQRERRFSTWKEGLDAAVADVLRGVATGDTDAVRSGFERVWESGGEAARVDGLIGSGRCAEAFELAYGGMGDKICSRLGLAVRRPLEGGDPSTDVLGQVEAGLIALLAHHRRDTEEAISDVESGELVGALTSVRSGMAALSKTAVSVDLSAYGQISFVGEDPRRWTADEALEAEMDYLARVEKAKAARVDPCGAASALDAGFFLEMARLMWRHADTVPFDVEAFDDVRASYNAFTAELVVVDAKKEETAVFGAVEEVIVRLYAKSKLGGAATVRQEERYVRDWIDWRIGWCDYDACFALCSGLAWLELYDLEKRTLQHLVERRVTLTAEMQERLSMLESGRSKSIRVYDVAPNGAFAFDSSSAEWRANEFSIFFRKLAMGKSSLRYSLALDKWSRALPLKRGQRVSDEELLEEFQDMVLDFDGEVSCERVEARAVDLANVRYGGAVLFSFHSERCRCLSVLFACEKYGRNLNVAIYTLFTLEPEMAVDELERYAAAAKGNVYMESFRESILQSLDDVLKGEKSIYGGEGEDAGLPGDSTRRVIE